MVDLKKMLQLSREKKSKERKGPLWKGPEEDGITFSLLSRFLVCRERFRILTLEGLGPQEGFNHKLEFGNMWHVCEETAQKGSNSNLSWETALNEYKKKLMEKYRLQQEDIARWSRIVAVMFRHYNEYWAKHNDEKMAKTLEREKVFNVSYPLPSGRVVRLKGKRDKVDLIGKGKDQKIYLQENKTKSRIDELSIRRQLTYDLQTMLYLVALSEENPSKYPIGGVRYNVIRRPELRQGKKESVDEFVNRVEETVKEQADLYFMRWKCEVSTTDIDNFRKDCLDPILENLCNWWHLQSGKPWTQKDLDNLFHGLHWRHPYGVYNVLDEGGSTDLDEYLATGSTVGLVRKETLFPELAV